MKNNKYLSNEDIDKWCDKLYPLERNKAIELAWNIKTFILEFFSNNLSEHIKLLTDEEIDNYSFPEYPQDNEIDFSENDKFVRVGMKLMKNIIKNNNVD